jgi:ribosomal protein L7/L12
MTPSEHYREIVKLCRKGDNISAIKYVRDSFGLALRESKDLVEAIAEHLDYKKDKE